MSNESNNQTNRPKPIPAGDLAGRLQQLRHQRGISQEELANALNVSRQAVSKWESAQAQPELEKLLALSNFFQVSTDYLLKGTPPDASASPDIANKPNALAYPPTGREPGAASLPMAVGQPQNRQLFVINATLFNYVGLLLSWALWDYWQLSICAFVGIIMAIIGAAVLAVGLSAETDAEQRRQLWRGFWRWNIWPVAQLLLGLLFSALCSRGRLLAPVIDPYFFGWAGGGLFVFCWGAWLIVCLSVWRACRNK